MGTNHSGIEGDSISRAGSGARPPLLSASRSETSPVSVQSALREVRPDDLDAIFDDALFGAPELEAASDEVARAPEGRAPVPVGAVEWYVERGAQAVGPFRLERLRELWHQGELGPDTLFWCEAWPNWMPLSHAPELVAALTIAGLPTVSVTATPASSKKAGSEAKKVVSALPSLVAEEEAWLRKMKEDREQAQEEERSALLDAPSAPLPSPVVPAHFVPLAPPVPQAAPVATAGLLAPVPPQMGGPVAPYPYPYPGLGVPLAPPVAPPMMAAPVPVEAPAPSRRGLLGVAGVVAGSTAVGLIVGALFLMPRLQGAPVPQREVSPPAVTSPVVAAAPVVQQPAPVAQQPAPVAQPVVSAPQPPPAVVPAPEAQAAKVITAPAPSAPVAAPEQPRKVAEVAPVAPEKALPGRRLAAVRPEESAPAPQLRSQPQPAPVAPVASPAHEALEEDKGADDPTNIDDSIDKDFERELGFAKDSPKNKPEDPRSKRTVYLPPEPGTALQESLSTSDIVQVVSAHKDSILSCIEAHEPPRTSDSGKDRFVLRWRVQTSGSASDVQMETDSLKGTPFARCMEGAVRSWKFPQHRVQSSEPIRFPFTY
ncbi:AgmX/PglI C-terminal domain-containing protein [Archangium lipolyticum]|uniref:AgmX/PglI C-terminal domain-containing protein n=1 Tax=Archangium lipolyticum TaxID=2970465 RepID=UPI00214A76AA|nr:AgmX/PglI C-terminal domain-containing protein [Archangium lipolyticum]